MITAKKKKTTKKSMKKKDEIQTPSVEHLKIVPLGGLGEVGKNMTVLEYKDDILIIDIGLKFPEENMPGIDLLVPNTGYLEDKKDKIRGIIITHGHLDHTGAFAYLQDKLGNPPVYTAELTKGMLLKRHTDFPNAPKPEVYVVKEGDKEKFGDHFEVEFLHLNHNIPDNLASIVKTPVGKVLLTSDFKFDPNPLNEKPADLDYIKKIGDDGVLVLMSDSTGAENPGSSISEETIKDNLEMIFKESEELIIAGTFASLLNRVQQLVELSEKYGRKVIFDGYSMKSNVEIAKELGYLKIKKGTRVEAKYFNDHDRSKITLIATGAQGEGNAVLMRVANKEHRFIELKKKDTVIFSSSVIPGNERSVQNLKDALYRAGAKVYHYKMMDIHAGGHAQQDDLTKMIELIRPKFFMPVHGQYSMMINHQELAMNVGIDEKNTIIADNGSIIHFTKDKWWFDKKTAPSNPIMIDGLGIGDVGNVVLRDRQIMSEDGMFVIITLIDSRTGRVKGSPDIISRGFVYLKENKELLHEVRKRIRYIVEKKTTHPINAQYLKDNLRDKIGQYLYQQTERRPMVLPVVIEI